MILPIDPAIHQQLERAVEDCGVPLGDVEITYEDWLQSEQILIRSKKLPDAQIRCILTIQLSSPFPTVLFEDHDVAKLSYELQHEDERDKAKKWLEARGLLQSLPKFDPGAEELGDFGRKLELFCGIEPGTLLIAHGSAGFTINADWFKADIDRLSDEQSLRFECVTKAISASNQLVGFIGNKAVGAPER